MQQYILKKIIQKRREKNFSQNYMASQLKISQSHYNKIENGKKKLTLDRILVIVRIFNISITDLFDADDNKSA